MSTTTEAEIEREVRAAGRRYNSRDSARADALLARNETIRRAVDAGFSYARIARLLGITKQAVAKVMRASA